MRRSPTVSRSRCSTSSADAARHRPGRLRALVATVLSLALLASAVPAMPVASAAPSAPASSGDQAQTAKKPVKKAKKKAKKKKKAKRTVTPVTCRPGEKLTGGRCVQGPYRPGQTCAMGEQDEYLPYGLICLDLSTPGFPLTTLDPVAG